MKLDRVPPLLANPANGFDGDLRADERVQLVEIDEQPEEPAARCRHDNHCLHNS